MKLLRNSLLTLFGCILFTSTSLLLPNLILSISPSVAATPTTKSENIHKSPIFQHHKLFQGENVGNKPEDTTNFTKSKSQIVATLLQKQGNLKPSDSVINDDSTFYDQYKFSGSKNQSIKIYLESQDFDTYLMLLDAQGNKLAENDDRGEDSSNSFLHVTLPKQNTYRVVVNSYQPQSQGKYNLRVVEDNLEELSENDLKDYLISANTNKSSQYSQKEFETLLKADRLYQQGKRTEAEKLYRQVKKPFAKDSKNSNFPEPINDPEQLSPAGKVYWREAQAGFQDTRRLESKIFVPLQLLSEKNPEFVPGHILLAQALEQYNKPKEAREVLERASSLFPYNPDVAKARVKALEADEQWLEASIAARQFAIVNPNHSENAEFVNIADKNSGRFRGSLNNQILTTAILGGLGGLLTGDFKSSAFQAVELAQLMLKGESAMGAQFANGYKQQLPLVQDEIVQGYINTIGQDIAKLMGRSEFNYEFYVVQDDSLNAFALPGGKVFINTGSILNTKSEAELAGLIGHEVGHAVLSHGYQRIANNSLLANLREVIPFGNFFTTLVSRDYSRGNERQSDIIGSRALASYGYAADGLRGFMQTLHERYGSSGQSYASTHPSSKERVRYLEDLITSSGYNRYAFEGVEKHSLIQKRVRELIGK
ncbi:M48 family metalloprotease [Cuspidothrix issatschenkoi LEGE 03284]|uniref:M48 family metalloprotease n=1 Tax=Cuspidothrix issatschenkoi TaxID=230752 RepID=UPI0018817F37|nr:M48 family metalloprotease [Cuspidothrix issatschenkoi]MBE9234179.1 M48 family metalloprotease [Cuspidothrix issatschenkoi LEGE 03284]